VFLAREGSASVGVATVTANFGIEYAWAAELEDLYVVPEHRGRGIARLLIEECEAWARRQGCSSVLVTVTPEGQHRHDLVGLYRHLGFADRGRKLLELGLDEE
jgi:putative acetyltransferase